MSPTVARPAVGFKFGSYPDKGFDCSREQFLAANAAAGTVPVGLNPLTLDHYVGQENILDGETGTAAYAVGDSGDLLPLRLDVPEWMSRLIDKHDLKLSAVFNNPVDRKLLKLDYVKRPRVREAAIGPVVLSDGQREPVDVAVEFAEAGPEGDDDHDPYQRMHEIAAAGTRGRACDPDWKPRGDMESACASMHDECVANGAHCDGPHAAADEPKTTTPKKGAVRMSAEVTTFSDEQLDEMEPAVAAALRQAQADRVRFSDQEKRAGDLAAEVRRLTEDSLRKDAVAFSDSLGEVLRPHQSKAAFALHKLCARLDREATQAVTFSDKDDKPVATSAVGLLKALTEGLTPHNLKGERVGFALEADPGDDDRKKADEAFDADVKAFAERMNPKKAS